VALARIGLGSNVGDASGTVARALVALEALGRVVARSSFYRTKAWGVTDQPDFVNAAALVETDLLPRALLAELKALESNLGRVETFRWGPRVIDLDILAYDDLALREPDLVIPHERLHERAFALAPLAEIDPGYGAAYAALPVAERDAVQRIPGEAARSRPVVHWDEVLDRVRTAAEFCAASGLARVRIDDAGLGIDVRRSPAAAAQRPPTHLESPHSANGVSSVAPAAVDERPTVVLKAEFVGVLRLSRPTVAPGTVLPGDRELAYVEALGIRNPVRSGGAGRVAEIFVSDGQPVEYGQPLFAIEK
jgi:2-amino-4-hydroxy-6-hydroxymethyldihydropteridine diphosphokinase